MGEQQTQTQTLRQNLRGLTSTEYEILRSMTHLSKNLYNKSLYIVRQHYFKNGEYLDYYDVYPRVKDNYNYDLLNSQMAQQTIKHVDRAFKSFFNLIEKKKEGKYGAEAYPPKYLDKNGYYQLTYPTQAFQIKEDHIRVGVPKQFREEFGYNKKEIKIPFTYNEITDENAKELQIIPKADAEYFEYRVVYEKDKQPVETDKDTFLAIDLGVDNLATCVDHTGRSYILCGRSLKSLNRWYNKEIARLQSIKDKQGIEKNTKKINKLFKDRKNKIYDYLDKAVRKIVDYCIENKIEKVLVGDGKGWKQKLDLGDKTNQNFVHIPFDIFKQKLKHKLELYGIEFKLVNESYTSKCSFFDDEDVKKHSSYNGRRIERGLFKTGDGWLVNADLNGALNIAKKYFDSTGNPEITERVRSSGVVATPQRISPTNTSVSMEDFSGSPAL